MYIVNDQTGRRKDTDTHIMIDLPEKEAKEIIQEWKDYEKETTLDDFMMCEDYREHLIVGNRPPEWRMEEMDNPPIRTLSQNN